MTRTAFCIILFMASLPSYGQWIQTNGPFGGKIVSMASSGTDVFAASNNSIWHSADDGITWSKVTDPPGSIEQILYKDSMLISIGVIVARSYDLGNTWTWGGSINVSPVTSAVVSGNDIIVGAWGFGAYRSSDNGNTWIQINNGMGPAYVRALAVNGSTLYAGTEYEGIFKSTNNGNTWVSDSLGLNGAPVRSMAVLNNEVFVGTQYQGVFRKLGSSWYNVNNGLTDLSVTALGTIGGNLVAGSASGVVSYSSNSGTLWSTSATILAEYIYDFQTHNNFLFAASDYDAVHRSSDFGNTWTESNINLINTDITCMTSIANFLIAGSGNNIHMSGDGGNTWMKVFSGSANAYIRTLLVADTTIFAGTQDGLYRSNDYGNTWVVSDSNISMPSITTLARMGNYLYATAYHWFYRSQDNGITWNLQINAGVTGNFTSIAVCDSLIFAGTFNGVYISSDSGSTFVPSTNGIGNANIKSLFATSNQVYASHSSGTYRTTDYGNNWSLVGNGLSSGNIESWAGSGSNIFAGGLYAVLRSTDNGSTWSAVSNYPENPSSGLTILDSVVYGGYSGVYKNVNLICNNTASSFSLSHCGAYTSPSGNYSWTASGIYADTVLNANGCDSIITINLTILPVPIIAITASGQVTFCAGDSVILSATPGITSYQWYRWNYAIPGATSADYTAKSRGKYKCIGQNSSLCSDTSNVITVSVPCIPIGPNHQRTSPIDVSETKAIQIYPNPGTGIFTVDSPSGQLQIFNSVGELILLIDHAGEETKIDISGLADGIYFIKLQALTSVLTGKFMLSR